MSKTFFEVLMYTYITLTQKCTKHEKNTHLSLAYSSAIIEILIHFKKRFFFSASKKCFLVGGGGGGEGG
jgi:hypothetical protein